MRSEFKLNNIYYKGRLPSQSLANQMASKVGQGTSEYADLTSWSAWVQQDWQEGVGRVKPHLGGGYLYGEVDSRVPGQLILPPLFRNVSHLAAAGVPLDRRYMPLDMGGEQTVGATITTTKMAVQFATPAVNPETPRETTMTWVYCQAPVGTVLNFEVRNNAGGKPGDTLLTSATVTVQEENPGFYWHGAAVGYSGVLSVDTTYWLCVFPTSGTIKVGYGTSGFSVASELLTSGTWTTMAGKYMMHIIESGANAPGSIFANAGTGFFRFTNNVPASTLYAHAGAYIFKLVPASDSWSQVGASGNAEINSSAVFAEKVYFGTVTTLTSYFMQRDETFAPISWVFEHPGYTGTFFARAAGYLWAAVVNTIFYSNDGVAWTENRPDMAVGTYEYAVTGMAPMGGSMYVATAEGLYRIAPGDFAVSVLPWGTDHKDNGKSMVNFQGSLYVAANDRVLRISEDHQMQDVWVSRDDDLMSGRLGRVQSLVVVGSQLLAYVASGATGSKPTVWAFSGNSWHPVVTLPESPLGVAGTVVNYSMFYDHFTDHLYLMTPQRVTYKVRISSIAINPYNDSATRYAPAAWMEWDWFDGPVIEAQKDFESVVIFGENLSPQQWVEVYWKDDDSTAWELLGVADSDNEELRWSDYATRPNSTRIKLGVLLRTNNGSKTPRIRAIRVKYHLMVRDWFRWNLQIDVSGRSGAYQMGNDGSRNTLTAAQIKDNLDALCKQVAPFIYQDVDGTQWEVKVVDANFAYTKYEYNESTANEWWEGVYNLVVEQVHPDAYVAP